MNLKLTLGLILLSIALISGVIFVLTDTPTECSKCLKLKEENQKLANVINAAPIDRGVFEANYSVVSNCCGQKVIALRFSQYTQREFCGKCGSLAKGCVKVESLGFQEEKIIPFSDYIACAEEFEILPADSKTQNCGNSNDAMSLSDAPCLNVDSKECKKKSYFEDCGNGWWSFDCSEEKNVARFKTLNLDGKKELRFNFLKVQLPENKTGLQICAYSQ